MNYAITLLTFQKIFVAVFLSKFCRQNDCRQSDFRQKVPVGKIIVDKVIVGKMIVGQVTATHQELQNCVKILLMTTIN